MILPEYRTYLSKLVGDNTVDAARKGDIALCTLYNWLSGKVIPSVTRFWDFCEMMGEEPPEDVMDSIDPRWRYAVGNRRNDTKVPICPYAPTGIVVGPSCTIRHCYKCGFNPRVQAKRMDAYRAGHTKTKIVPLKNVHGFVYSEATVEYLDLSEADV